MTKQKTEHEDTGQSMKTQHRDAANIPPLSFLFLPPANEVAGR